MRRTGIFALLLLITISFGIAGGCSNSNNNGNDGQEPGAEAPEFDLDLAIELGELALVAYEQRIQCINGGKSAITVPAPFVLEEVIFQGVSSFFNSTCQDDDGVIPIAFVATKEEGIYVSFRGTANFTDAITDIAAIQLPYNFVPTSGKVSGGFQGVYTGTDDFPIESTILSKVDELAMTGNFTTLYITGHSLGAALAFLAFPDFSQNTTNIDTVIMYNFAGPAAGDSAWVSTYEGEYAPNRISFRIVNTNDLVPMLPPLGLDCTDFSYFHVDNKHEITFGVTLPPLPDFADDNCNLLSIGGQLATYGINNQNGILEDHSMCTYYKTLCDMTSDPSSCAGGAVGCDDGNMNP
ncbi:MAG: lipase family protein, partial [Thermodesulfobacteriota bacterium]